MPSGGKITGDLMSQSYFSALSKFSSVSMGYHKIYFLANTRT